MPAPSVCWNMDSFPNPNLILIVRSLQAEGQPRVSQISKFLNTINVTHDITRDKALKQDMKKAKLTPTDLKPALASFRQPGGTIDAPKAAGNTRMHHGQVSSCLHYDPSRYPQPQRDENKFLFNAYFSVHSSFHSPPLYVNTQFFLISWLSPPLIHHGAPSPAKKGAGWRKCYSWPGQRVSFTAGR